MAAVDIAHFVSGIARRRPYLTAPDPPLSFNAHKALTPHWPTQVRTTLRTLGGPTTSIDFAHNRKVPLPRAERQELATAAEAAVTTTMQAATASALIGKRRLIAEHGRSA